MSNYIDYLADRTNTVMSQKKLSMTIQLAAYLGIWAFGLMVFWFWISGSDAMGYSLIFLWIILPAATFVISLLIGKNHHLGKGKWLTPIVCGAMHMLAEYATFSVRNMIAISFARINMPHFEMFLIGALFSVIGLFFGSLAFHLKASNRD